MVVGQVTLVPGQIPHIRGVEVLRGGVVPVVEGGGERRGRREEEKGGG